MPSKSDANASKRVACALFLQVITIIIISNISAILLLSVFSPFLIIVPIFIYNSILKIWLPNTTVDANSSRREAYAVLLSIITIIALNILIESAGMLIWSFPLGIILAFFYSSIFKIWLPNITQDLVRHEINRKKSIFWGIVMTISYPFIFSITFFVDYAPFDQNGSKEIFAGWAVVIMLVFTLVGLWFFPYILTRNTSGWKKFLYVALYGATPALIAQLITVFTL